MLDYWLDYLVFSIIHFVYGIMPFILGEAIWPNEGVCKSELRRFGFQSCIIWLGYWFINGVNPEMEVISNE